MIKTICAGNKYSTRKRWQRRKVQGLVVNVVQPDTTDTNKKQNLQVFQVCYKFNLSPTLKLNSVLTFAAIKPSTKLRAVLVQN